jgi:hypothetical protein
VAARTCLRWLTDLSARAQVQEAVLRGVSITFVVQDLYDKLADPRFAELREDLRRAELGWSRLVESIEIARTAMETSASPLPAINLVLKYSSEPIGNSRTLILRAGAFYLLRYV